MKPVFNSVALALVLWVTACTPSGSSYRLVLELNDALTRCDAEEAHLTGYKESGTARFF